MNVAIFFKRLQCWPKGASRRFNFSSHCFDRVNALAHTVGPVSVAKFNTRSNQMLPRGRSTSRLRSRNRNFKSFCLFFCANSYDLPINDAICGARIYEGLCKLTL